MFAEFMAALKAIAALPDLLRQITNGIEQIRVARETQRIQEIKNEVARITDQIRVTTDRQALLDLARQLNDTVSK